MMVESDTFSPGCAMDSSHSGRIKPMEVFWDCGSRMGWLEESVVVTVLVANSANSGRRHAIDETSS